MVGGCCSCYYEGGGGAVGTSGVERLERNNEKDITAGKCKTSVR